MEKFTKDMLKTGMWLQQRNGEFYIVLLNTHIGDVMSGQTWCAIDAIYYNDLTCRLGEYRDIVKIYQPKDTWCFVSNKRLFNLDEADLIWERQEPKEMTVEEINENLIKGIGMLAKSLSKAADDTIKACKDFEKAFKEGADKC